MEFGTLHAKGYVNSLWYNKLFVSSANEWPKCPCGINAWRIIYHLVNALISRVMVWKGFLYFNNFISCLISIRSDYSWKILRVRDYWLDTRNFHVKFYSKSLFFFSLCSTPLRTVRPSKRSFWLFFIINRNRMRLTCFPKTKKKKKIKKKKRRVCILLKLCKKARKRTYWKK